MCRLLHSIYYTDFFGMEGRVVVIFSSQEGIREIELNAIRGFHSRLLFPDLLPSPEHFPYTRVFPRVGHSVLFLAVRNFLFRS